jgi:hypothetical protein
MAEAECPGMQGVNSCYLALKLLELFGREPLVGEELLDHHLAVAPLGL